MSDANDMLAFNRALIDEFRANAGKVGGQFTGMPMLLLTTIGAKSGEPRTSPLAYTRDGDHYVVIASKAGAPANPAWFGNLVANPSVTVEVDGERFEATAHVAQGDERQRLYDAQAAILPTFTEYQQRTTRQIPVVVLERR